MKKVVTALIVLYALTLSLFAGVSAIVSVKPFFTGNTIPSVDPGNGYNWSNVIDPTGLNYLDNDWWMTRQDYWLNAYGKTSFLDLGIAASYGGFNFVTRLDFAQDFLVNLQNPQGG